MDHPKMIDLGRAIQRPLARRLFGLVERPVERVLRLEQINDIYARVEEAFWGAEGEPNFFHSALQILGVRYRLAEDDRGKIPANGPVFVISNHPFGALDGLVLGAVLTDVRPDVRFLVNYLLDHVRLLRPWIIAVDPFGGGGAAGANLRPLREALAHLRGGGLLSTFPSGTVSHLHLSKGRVTDPPWSPHIAALARRAGATVVPVFFEGRNSALFQAAGVLHPLLRTALLPAELCRRAGADLEVKVRVGAPVAPGQFGRFGSDRELVDFFRAKTYLLKDRGERQPGAVSEMSVGAAARPGASAVVGGGRVPSGRGGKSAASAPRGRADLIAPAPPDALAAEVGALPPESLLVEHGEFAVHVAAADQLPLLLPEIGRLREQTFREVGEGTGKACDLDRFDPHYLHLFMWDREARAVVGAYRVGRADEILRERGLGGLYTASMFRFKAPVLERLGQGLEMGRSFIVSSYQRRHASLALIWKGIGAFLCRYPQYALLFGPVSISQAYQSISKDLMVQFLRTHKFDRGFAQWVKAKRPPRPRPGAGRLSGAERRALAAGLQDVDDVSALVSEIETDRKGIPVLLRHYLKLNGTLVSFNVDADFSHCIDGLIMVDLTKTDPKILRRYLGPEGAAAFMERHGVVG